MLGTLSFILFYMNHLHLPNKQFVISKHETNIVNSIYYASSQITQEFYTLHLSLQKTKETSISTVYYFHWGNTYNTMVKI